MLGKTVEICLTERGKKQKTLKPVEACRWMHSGIDAIIYQMQPRKVVKVEIHHSLSFFFSLFLSSPQWIITYDFVIY